MELDETKEELQALVVATELLGSQAALPNGIFDSKKVEKLKPASRRILGVAESCKGPELIEALRKSVKNLTRPDCSVTAIQSAFIVLALDLLVAPSSSSNPTVSPLSNPTSYSKAPSESTTETLTSEILAREDLARAHADLEQSNKMLQKARQDLALSKKKEEQASTESERKATEAISKLDRVKAKLARANADLLEANEKATKLQDGLRLAKKKEKIAAVEFASRKHQWKIVVDELQDETRDLRDEVEGLEAQARANELSSASKISEYMSIITQLGENVKTLSAEVKKRMDENAMDNYPVKLPASPPPPPILAPCPPGPPILARPAAPPSRPSVPSSSPARPPVPSVQSLPTPHALPIKKRKVQDGPTDEKTELEVAKEELEAAKARIHDLEHAAESQKREEAGARELLGKFDDRLKGALRLKLGVSKDCDGKALVKAFETTIQQSDSNVSLLSAHTAFSVLARDLLTATPPKTQRLKHDPTRDENGDRLPLGWVSCQNQWGLRYRDESTGRYQDDIPAWPMDLDDTKDELRGLDVAAELLGSQGHLPYQLLESRNSEKLKPASRRILGVPEGCQGPELFKALKKAMDYDTRSDCSLTAVQSAFIVLARDLLVDPSASPTSSRSPSPEPEFESRVSTNLTSSTTTSLIIAREQLARAQADLQQSNSKLQKSQQDLALSKQKEAEAIESERKMSETCSTIDTIEFDLIRANAAIEQANAKLQKSREDLALSQRKLVAASESERKSVEMERRKWQDKIGQLEGERRGLQVKVMMLEEKMDDLEEALQESQMDGHRSMLKSSELEGIVSNLHKKVKALNTDLRNTTDEIADLLVKLGEKA
ncbi:hypothetical protein RQP46_002232 [Phenoliferia psychrophenolica]